MGGKKRQEVIGRRFDRLLVVSLESSVQQGCQIRRYCKCLCDCGNVITIREDHLLTGNTKSCGCYKIDKAILMSPRKDLIGMRFGRLLVVKEEGRTKEKSVLWGCLCDCGNYTIVISGSLQSGATTSCGCYGAEARRASRLKHGMSGTKMHYTYVGILHRCYNKNSNVYHNYGGRGISVCDEWVGPEGLINFVRDMGVPPSDKHQIDRINNDGPYSPENCRWVTSKENCRNTRRNINITFNGKNQCVAAWAEETGVNSNRIYDELKKGLTLEQILSQCMGCK